MYSQQELDEAVASGAITAQAADALRDYVSTQRSVAIPDEEQFRLLTGFNDIFVSIAAAILLFAVGWIGQRIGEIAGLSIPDGPSFGGLLAAASGAVAAGAAWFTGAGSVCRSRSPQGQRRLLRSRSDCWSRCSVR